MKRFIAILLLASMLLSGCGSVSAESIASAPAETEAVEEKVEVSPTSAPEEEADEPEAEPEIISEAESTEDISFTGLSDPELLDYMEENVYLETVKALDSDEYFVEDVSAVYISKEYLDELSYNSQSNIFFGYSLQELDSQFEGKKYIFTLDDEGKTGVEELETFYDDTYDRAIKNVAIGTGVILVCVTVSKVSALVPGGQALSLIFAVSAETAKAVMLSSAAQAGLFTALIKGYETGDFDEALKAGVLGASEGYKFSIILGSLLGGTSGLKFLKTIAAGGLTLNEAAIIQKASKWPPEIIKQIHSMSEYQIYEKAGLVPTKLSNGKWALTKEIDWNIIDEFGRTNAQRVLENLSPLDADGLPIELHHIGQNAEGTLATLSRSEHRSKLVDKILHYADEGKNISEAEWAKQRHEFWKLVLEEAQKGGLA